MIGSRRVSAPAHGRWLPSGSVQHRAPAQLSRTAAALLAAAALAGTLLGCSGGAAAPAREAPAPKTLAMAGATAEVSVLSSSEGTAQHPQLNIPGYTERVMWVQVAFRFLSQPARPTLDRTWFFLRDSDGRADPRITHLGPDGQALNPDAEHPVLDPVSTLATGETISGFLAFPPAELVFTASSIVFHPPGADQVSWSLAGLPGTPVGHQVQFPAAGTGAVPGQSSLVQGREWTGSGQHGRLVPARLQITLTDLRNRPDKVAEMPSHRVEQVTVTVTNQGGQAVFVDPALALDAVDGEGHFYPIAGLDRNEFAADSIPPGGTRTGDVIIPVPEHSVLDHLRFALSEPGGTGITWWRLR
jgi:hypothetical protein